MCWRDIENPWAGIANDWLNLNWAIRRNTSFVLGDDRNNIIPQNGFHPEIPPQPFIGNPDAPIWILSLNPGYCAHDRFDYLGDNGNIRNEDATNAKYKATINQLYLLENSNFYVLDQKFNCFRSYQERGERPRCAGAYQWWNLHMARIGLNQEGYWCQGNNAADIKNFVDTHFFVLEYCPYHSVSWNGNCRRAWNNAQSPAKTYRDAMLRWATVNGKIFIVRSYGNWQDIMLENNTFGNFAQGNQHRIYRCTKRSFFINEHHFRRFPALLPEN